MEEFQAKVPLDPGEVFWTHLELLRKCKFVGMYIYQKVNIKSITIKKIYN